MALSQMTSRFHRQLAKRKALQGVAAVPPGPISWLSVETISHVAQIALAVVAIFGYFYTVLPVYQKERLAEQVAEYEGIIKKQGPKIAEAEQRLTDLEQERWRLTQNLKNIEGQLSIARDQKSRIEGQIQYMTFRYRLPDGTPATTPQQVRTVQAIELRRSFLSALFMSCALGMSGDVFPSYSYIKEDEKSKFWPFTEREIGTWKEFGTRYPLKRANECIESVAARLSQRNGKDSSADGIEEVRKEAVQHANSAAAAKQWSPPFEPTDLLQELSNKRSAIESDMNAELRKVEEQYGDWESTFGESRRAIFKHNYEVGKQNAKNQAVGSRISLASSTQEKANVFRKNINQEVRRLILSETKNDPK